MRWYFTDCSTANGLLTMFHAYRRFFDLTARILKNGSQNKKGCHDFNLSLVFQQI